MDIVIDPDHERRERVRNAVVEQAVALGCRALARQADTATTRAQLMDAAVADLCSALESDEDDVRLSLAVGIMVGALGRELDR